MTTHTIAISTTYNSEFNLYSTSQPAATTVVQGDSIRFIWTLHNGSSNEPAHITVSGLDSAVFDNASNITLSSPGGEVTRSIKTNASLGLEQVVFTPSNFSYPSKTANITVDSSLDQDPTAFNLGSDIDNVNPSQAIEGRQFTVTGLSTGANAPVSITGGQYSKNGAAYTSSAGTVNNGDTIRTRITSSANFSTSITCTLTIGTITDSWKTTTRNDPGNGYLIPFGFTNGEPLELWYDVAAFYGFRYNITPFAATLVDYVRGGDFVPDIAQNIGVPSAPPIELGDLRGSYTSFYWEKLPSFKATSHDSTGSGTTIMLGWSTLETPIESSDFYVGYGEGARNVAEYRYTVTGLSGGGVYVTTSNYGTWSIANDVIALALDVSQGQAEQQYTGTITIYARHPADPNNVLTTTVDYSFFVFGE